MEIVQLSPLVSSCCGGHQAHTWAWFPRWPHCTALTAIPTESCCCCCFQYSHWAQGLLGWTPDSLSFGLLLLLPLAMWIHQKFLLHVLIALLQCILYTCTNEGECWIQDQNLGNLNYGPLCRNCWFSPHKKGFIITKWSSPHQWIDPQKFDEDQQPVGLWLLQEKRS